MQGHVANVSSSHDLIQYPQILNFFIPHGNKLAYFQLGYAEFFASKVF